MTWRIVIFLGMITLIFGPHSAEALIVYHGKVVPRMAGRNDQYAGRNDRYAG